MSLPVLLGHQWRRHRIAVLPMAAGAGLFQFLLTRMAPVDGGDSWISRAFEAVPPQLLALAGGDIRAQLTAGGFLAVGYGHPFFLLLLGAWVVRVSCGALAGEVGQGTMELLASRPMARWKFVVAGWLACLAGLTVILLAAWAATALGSSLRQLGVGRDFGQVAAGVGCLFAAWSAIGLLVGATRRDGGSAIGWTAGIIAVSFVLDYLARMWAPIHGLQPLSLFRYYQPQTIVAAGLNAGNLLVLGGVTISSVIAAIIVFRGRDL